LAAIIVAATATGGGGGVGAFVVGVAASSPAFVSLGVRSLNGGGVRLRAAAFSRTAFASGTLAPPPFIFFRLPAPTQ